MAEQREANLNDPILFFASKCKMDFESAVHSHSDFTEIALILSGKGRYVVNGNVYDVESGDVIVCNKGDEHGSYVTYPDNPTTEIIIGFTNYSFEGMEWETIILPDGSNCFKPDDDVRRELIHLGYETALESASVKPGKSAMLKSYLIRILVILMREMVESSDENKGYDFDTYGKNYAVRRIKNYLNAHYSEHISLEQIAKNMYLSPVYISKIFKEETGEPPIGYLIGIRLKRAKEMLENDESKSIKGIADEVGYDDVYHFSKLFKKYYGESPQNYRKRMKIGNE